jgi:hypothetical protein
MPASPRFLGGLRACKVGRVRIPIIVGTIERRLLINFRVVPEVLARVVPPPFRPLLVAGWGVAGICLIRLSGIRPRWVPGSLGIRSENAAHRIAVEWEVGRLRREGVYIPRRDTSSRLNACAGGRLFPGVHNHAKFTVHEGDDRYSVALTSEDDETRLAVSGRLADSLPPDSIFGSLAEASSFFERGALGYSATRVAGVYDGLELRTGEWKVEPLAVDHVESSFFADRARFPEGSVHFDNALLMRNIRHRWIGRETLRAGG